MICVEETLELCLCSQGYGDIPQDTYVQSEELRLWLFHINHTVTICRWRTHCHLVNALQTIWKSWSAQIVEKVDGDHLGEGTWQVFCLEILDVPIECSSLQCCSVCLVPKQRGKYHGRAFSSCRGTIYFKQSNIFFPACQPQFTLSTRKSKLNSLSLNSPSVARVRKGFGTSYSCLF